MVTDRNSREVMWGITSDVSDLSEDVGLSQYGRCFGDFVVGNSAKLQGISKAKRVRKESASKQRCSIAVRRSMRRRVLLGNQPGNVFLTSF